MTFAEKFYKLRKSAGLSQQQAAKRLGVSRQAVSRWEHGTALPDSLNIAGICTVFGVSADYIVNDDVIAVSVESSSVAPSEESVSAGKNLFRLGILFHAIAFVLELVGIVCFVCSAVTAFCVLFFVGLAASVIGIIAAEYVFCGKEIKLRSEFRKRYYSRSVWLFLPLPLVVFTVAVAYFAAVGSSEYGSFTLPVFLLSFIALVVYFFISLVLTILLSDKK